MECVCDSCRGSRMPPASEEDLKLAVKYGAAWLDQREPEWVSKIKLESLKMDDTGQCILGQCLGYYYTAQEILGYSTDEWEEWAEWAQDNGFNVANTKDYHRIQGIWVDYIKETRGQ